MCTRYSVRDASENKKKLVPIPTKFKSTAYMFYIPFQTINLQDRNESGDVTTNSTDIKQTVAKNCY